MKKNLFLLMVLATILLNACCSPDANENKATGEDSLKAAQVNNDHLIMSVLFWQQAAENRALFYQAMNAARMTLDNDLKAKGKEKKAVVLDIDETALDNSPYEAKCIIEGFGYPEKWEEWCNSASAEPCPGILELLKYAESKGYDIFYITNRKEKLREGTLKNLKEKGFPMADEAHVMFKTDDNSKEGRRQTVTSTHRIALLIGDNLADFTQVFDQKLNPESRALKTDSLKAEFGKRFILLPNAMYGDWEMAMYPDPKASAKVKDSIRRALLKAF